MRGIIGFCLAHEALETDRARSIRVTRPVGSLLSSRHDVDNFTDGLPNLFALIVRRH